VQSLGELDLTSLQRGRPWKQDVVFKGNVLEQIGFELDQRSEKCTVRVAGPSDNVRAEGQMAHWRAPAWHFGAPIPFARLGAQYSSARASGGTANGKVLIALYTAGNALSKPTG
jgi:hypothetical protein